MKYRKLLAFIFLSILHLSFIIEHCEAQWVQGEGIYGGTILSLISSGNNIFAGTGSDHPYMQRGYGGVYLTTNNGINWIQTTLYNKDVSSLAKLGNYIFAGTWYNGISLTTNNGVNWTQTSLNNRVVLSMAVLGNNIFAGTGMYGVYRSTNNGTNWTQTALGAGFIVYSLAVSGNKLFAGTESDGVFLSQDTGTSWTQTALGAGNLILSLLTSGNNVFAGTAINPPYKKGCNGGTSTGVYLSTNNGTNWTQLGLNGASVVSLAKIGNNIFAGTAYDYYNYMGGGLYRSTNNGTEWTLISFNNKDVWALLTKNDTVFAGTNYGAFYSANNGSNWTLTALNNADVTCLAVIGNNYFAGLGFMYNSVYYEWNNGIYKSTDYGLSWTHNSFKDKLIRSLFVYDNKLFVGEADSGIYMTTNNGNNWIHVAAWMGPNCFAAIGGDILAGAPGDLLRSTNGGINWFTVSGGPATVHSLFAIDTILLAGTKGYYPELGSVWRSTNNGYNWTQTSLTNNNVTCFAASGNFIYAGSANQGSSSGIFRSTNGGINWTQDSYMAGREIYALAVNGNYVFTGTGYYNTPSLCGVWLTTNNGNNWVLKNEGFMINPKVQSLLISNNYIFAGTNVLSVWRRPLSDLVGINNVNPEITDKFSLQQNCPNPFNPVTKIKFEISVNSVGQTFLSVYDLLGREVATIVNEKLQPGSYEVTFDGSNYPSGVYFYTLTTDEYSETKKMLLIK